MRKIYLLLAAIAFSGFVSAQESNPQINFSGFVGYELFYDTYESVDSRDGEVYLYPLPANLDVNDNDLNKNSQIEMLSLSSRIRLGATGFKALGGDVSGMIETDFLGTGQPYTRMLRLRHAIIKVNWESGELLMGQYWHPMFVTSCFPSTIAFGAGVPFHPLNRAPQIRYTHNITGNLTALGALLVHGYHRSSGPADAQVNSGIPDMQMQVIFDNKSFLAGFTAGYKVLKPRIQTILNEKTDQTIGSFNLQAFTRLSLSSIEWKLEGVFGENLTNFVMIGGYGAAENPIFEPDYTYTNIRTMSVWTDFKTKLDAFNFGIFGGYAANLGAKEEYFSLGYGRGEDIANIFRVSPRVTYSTGEMRFAFEHMMTGATYGTQFDDNQKATETADPTINHRFLVTVRLNF